MIVLPAIVLLTARIICYVSGCRPVVQTEKPKNNNGIIW